MNGSRELCQFMKTWKIGMDGNNNLETVCNQLKTILTFILIFNSNEDIIVAKGASGESKHYLCKEDSDFLSKITEYNGPNIVPPNDIEIPTTKKGQLPLFKHLSEK